MPVRHGLVIAGDRGARWPVRVLGVAGGGKVTDDNYEQMPIPVDQTAPATGQLHAHTRARVLSLEQRGRFI